MSQFRIAVPKGKPAIRLDLLIHQHLSDLSRRKIRRLIDSGGVYLNGKRVKIASRLVSGGDHLSVEYDLQVLEQLRKPSSPLTQTEILFSSDDVVIVNKPAGVPSQPTKLQPNTHIGQLVSDYLKEHQATNHNITLVHRLDQETSGAMIFARNKTTADFLSEQFKHQRTKKEYLAVAFGTRPKPNFTENARLGPIDRDGMVRVDNHGKTATTNFELIGCNDERKLNLIRCTPLSGRTHQIRVHLAHQGLPIVGDKRYCTSQLSLPEKLKKVAALRHFLHAATLAIDLGDGQNQQRFTAPLHPDLNAALQEIGLDKPLSPA